MCVERGGQAGAVSEVRLVIAAGQVLHWRFGTESKDVVFSVEAVPVAADATLCCGAIDLASRDPNVAHFGVHDLAVDTERNAWQSVMPNATIVVAAVRTNSIAGHWSPPIAPTPQSDASDPQRYCVRLVFDNSFSWFTSKSLARRIDVTPRQADIDARVAPVARVFAVDHAEGMRLTTARYAFWNSMCERVVIDPHLQASAIASVVAAPAHATVIPSDQDHPTVAVCGPNIDVPMSLVAVPAAAAVSGNVNVHGTPPLGPAAVESVSNSI
jgi:hypothetical protein